MATFQAQLKLTEQWPSYQKSEMKLLDSEPVHISNEKNKYNFLSCGILLRLVFHETTQGVASLAGCRL